MQTLDEFLDQQRLFYEEHAKLHAPTAFCGTSGPEEKKHLSGLLHELSDDELERIIKKSGEVTDHEYDRDSYESMVEKLDREYFYGAYNNIKSKNKKAASNFTAPVIDESWVRDLGIDKSKLDLEKLANKVEGELELRVGLEIMDNLSDEQIKAFKKISNDETGSLDWLKENYPDFQQVVKTQYDELLEELRESKDKVAHIESWH